MTQEELDFIYFKNNELYSVDFQTGVINTKTLRRKNGHTLDTYLRITKDAGSKNPDGYIRIWCNGRLRMKHRLLFWLFHGNLPNEIDHINRIRDDNRISNLRSVNRSENNKGYKSKGRKRFTEEDLHNICKDISSKQYSDEFLANKYNCSRIAIMDIRRKRRHADIANLYF